MEIKRSRVFPSHVGQRLTRLIVIRNCLMRCWENGIRLYIPVHAWLPSIHSSVGVSIQRLKDAFSPLYPRSHMLYCEGCDENYDNLVYGTRCDLSHWTVLILLAKLLMEVFVSKVFLTLSPKWRREKMCIMRTKHSVEEKNKAARKNLQKNTV